jgi:hypothetical protein
MEIVVALALMAQTVELTYEQGVRTLKGAYVDGDVHTYRAALIGIRRFIQSDECQDLSLEQVQELEDVLDDHRSDIESATGTAPGAWHLAEILCLFIAGIFGYGFQDTLREAHPHVDVLFFFATWLLVPILVMILMHRKTQQAKRWETLALPPLRELQAAVEAVPKMRVRVAVELDQRDVEARALSAPTPEEPPSSAGTRRT